MPPKGTSLNPLSDMGLRVIYRSLSFLILLLSLSACSDGGYFLQAAKGQYEILKKRQPIADLLSSGDLNQQQQLKLTKILEIRSFASTQLKLPENDSYLSYVELGRKFPIWNVVAAPEFSLTPRKWCFPIAGCVNYRGYFTESDAEDFALDLEQKNFDTLVKGVPAYSTLKWFDDPVLSSFSSWPAASVARLIFHELAHQQLYLPGDSEFSEAFATSVEIAGVKRWLTDFGSEKERQAFDKQLKREETFVAWTNALHLKLSRLYSSSISTEEMRQQKREIFNAARKEYLDLKKSWEGYAGYDHWVNNLNNARLASLQTYRRLMPAFERLLTEKQYNFKEYYSACQILAEQPAELREKQLFHLLKMNQSALAMKSLQTPEPNQLMRLRRR